MTDAKPDLSIQSPRDVLLFARAMIRRSKRYWPIGLITFLLAVAAFLFTPKVIKPIYLSESVIQHREVIQTQSLLGRPEHSESPRSTAMRLREMLLSRSNLEEIVRIHALYPDTVASKGIVTAVDEFRQDTQVRVQEGETFAIQFRAHDPQVVQTITKALADSLVEQNRQYREEKAQATKRFLQVEAERTAVELNNRQQALAVFLALHPEFAQEQGREQMTAGASVRAAARAETSSDTQLSALQRQANRLRQQIDSPAATPTPTPTPSATLDPESARAIADAERQLAAARRNLADKQSRYTQQHPDVAAAESQVRAAEARLAAATAAATTTQPSSPAAQPMPTDPEERRERLRAQLRRVESMIARLNRGEEVPEAEASAGVVALETEWARLNRDLDDVRARNEQIQGRLFRASIIANVEASGKSSQMVVVDPAYLPKRPATRGPRRTGAVAAMLVMMLGTGLVFGLGFFNDRVYDEYDLHRLDLGPIVHAVPALPKKAGRTSHA